MNRSISDHLRWTTSAARQLAVALTLTLGGAALMPSIGAADTSGAPPLAFSMPRIAAKAPALDSAAKLRSQTDSLADLVSKTAQHLESLIAQDAVKAATTVYKLELASARILAAIGSDVPLTEAERDQLEEMAVYIHRNILLMQERVRGYAMAELDRVLPGEPGAKVWRRKATDLYRPLFRAVGPNGPTVANSPAERKSVLAKMKADFQAAGGTAGDIYPLNAKTLALLGSAELVEWVQIGDDIQFSQLGKHPVIADGASVSGAGSLQIIRGIGGDVMAAIVSNTSGNYKPGMASVIAVTNRLIALDVDPNRIIATSAQPGDPSSIKLIMRAQKQTKSKIETKMRDLKSWQARALSQGTRPGAVKFKVAQAKKAKR